jgi:hypothetical protein
MCITCKCDRVLCFGCKYPEDHSCTFDYKEEEHREKLEQLNPIVKPKKLEKV